MLPRLALIAALCCAGCARPYAGPKTMAAIGTAVLVGGGTAWAVGERTDRPAMITPGFVGTVLGAAVIIAAGGWLAASINCHADPDCPEGEQCKEVPAPPGGIPYRQCVKR
jgi:hypothetical protein